MLSFLFVFLLPLTVVRPRAGIYLLTFLLPFMPRYLGWGIGEEGLALSPRRIATFACLLGLAGLLILRSGLVDRLIVFMRQNKFFFLILLALYVAKASATVVNSGLSANLLYVIDDLIISWVPALGLLLFVRTVQDENLIIVLIVVALAITGSLALIEALKGSVLLQGLVEVSVEEAGIGGLADRIRGGFYRSKALFDNPLLLSEFICITWPWAMYLWAVGGRSTKYLLGLTAMVAAPATLFVTHARSGWLVFLFGIGTYASLRLWGRSSHAGRLAMAILLSVAVIAMGGFAYEVLLDPTAYITAGAEGTSSLAERLNQYVVVGIAWTESPLLGYGMTRNFTQDLEFLNNLDSYWLRLVLEGGAVSVLLFAAMSAYILVTTFDEYASAPSIEYRRFMTAAFVSLLAFLLYKLFVSMPTNNAYFYIIAVLVLRRKYWRKRIFSDARIART